MSVHVDFDDQPITVDDNGCWIWGAYADRNGYPRHAGHWAHRVAYERSVGPIPDGYQIDHLCNVPLCVNPAHLEAVTRTENMRRVFERNGTDARHVIAANLRAQQLTYDEIAEVLNLSGRGSAGSMVKSAIRKGLVDPDGLPESRRLSPSEMKDIADLYALGVSQRDLAAWYGVDDSNISRAISGRRRSVKAA